MKLTLKYTGTYTKEGAVHFRSDKPLDQSIMYDIGEQSVRSIERHYNDAETKQLTGKSITEREGHIMNLRRVVWSVFFFIAGLGTAILIIKL